MLGTSASLGVETRRNVELKARISSLEQARCTARRVSNSYLGRLHQKDTYFRCRHGRLKLREVRDQPGELIWYQRASVVEVRKSDYHVIPVQNCRDLSDCLAAADGIRVVVCKLREVFLVNNVRIHIDQVEFIGNFLEFEAVLDTAAEEVAGYEQLNQLKNEFKISSSDLIAGSYSDLLEQHNSLLAGADDEFAVE